MKKILLVGLSLLMACPTFAKIKLPALVGSNMVLQREREVNLWGEASPSKKVTVTTSWTAANIRRSPTPTASGC